MRVDVSNLAAAKFNFPSIISSKSLFAENPEQKDKREKSLRVNLEKLSAAEKDKSTRPLIA